MEKNLKNLILMQQSKGWYRWAWGIVEGCTNECKYCYAQNIVKNFNRLKFHEELLNEPFKVEPSRIFVNWLSDIMLYPDEIVNKILEVCDNLPKHEFIFMTKTPQRYANYEFPDNCILGVTIEQPEEWVRANLMEQFTNRKMCSIEPILGNFTGKDFSQFEFVVVGSLIENNTHEFYDTVKHPKIYYTR